jgi:hypothetical protein
VSDTTLVSLGLPLIPLIESINVAKPEEATLWMPSQLPSALREELCAPGLIEAELRLRISACESDLHHIRRHICILTALIQHKKVHVDGPGQKQNL